MCLLYDFNCRLYSKKPYQLTIALNKCTCIIFRSGQGRIMGKSCYVNAMTQLQTLLDVLQFTFIQSPLLVTQTIVFQLDIQYTPVNLLFISTKVNDIVNVKFEYEIFPALSLHYWKPLHVNVFANGKVVVLGKNSSAALENIRDWLINVITTQYVLD